MNKLFSDFPKVSKEQWEEKLSKELKGADFNSSLNRTDEIEDFSFPMYAHVSDSLKSVEIPGQKPFKRGNKSVNNDWNIAALIEVVDEEKANQRALELLMTGCTSLIFCFQKKEIDFSILFNEIGFEFIQTQFQISNFNHYSSLVSYFKEMKSEDIMYRIDFNSSEFNKEDFSKYASVNKISYSRFCFVDGFHLQQCGATIIQELSFALASGNEYIVRLLEEGYSLNQAVSSIHFSLGVGSNYFYEISKIRAFRKLWSQLINAYDSTNEAVNSCFITSEIGHLNKSLKDPYTNLLRQTTEAMSVISAGVETVLVHPYDSKSTKGFSELSARMATNISLVLKDESYFDKVVDPIGGSYSIEHLTEQIAEKTWIYFQKIDQLGGVLTEQSIQFLRNEVLEKSKLKIEKIKSGKQMLIGINKYPNPQNQTNTWLPKETFLGMDQLVFERDIQ